VSTQVYPDADLLLMRMRAGDRDAAAEFLTHFGPRIRRRVRGKLPTAVRRLFDSQEIMSTLGRRLDKVVRSGQIRASSLPELWGLVFRITDHSVIEKARLFRSLETREGEDGPIAHQMLERLKQAEQREEDGPLIEVDAALRSLESGVDREILSLWLMGNSQADIAQTVGLAATAVRKRWEKIRGKLRDLVESGGC
jgi:DNA-directed RNA polymerase specialized sigma24 family protein